MTEAISVILYHHWAIILFITAAVVLSIAARKLTIAAAVMGGVEASLIYLGFGYAGICMLATFFIAGTVATSWKAKLKEERGLAESNKGKRTAGQVVANGGTAAILGMLAYRFPLHASLLQLMMTASIASATADTLSSELGNIYGQRFYNIVSFKKDTRGLDGVVSLEGTLCGVAGSVLISLIYFIATLDPLFTVVIILSGTIGNIVDSLLGATLERSKVLSNDTVNFLNTLTGAIAACMLYYLL